MVLDKDFQFESDTNWDALDSDSAQVGSYPYFKFTTIGDKIRGFYIKSSEVESSGVYKAQYQFIIMTPTGEEFCVARPQTSYWEKAVKDLKVGDKVQFSFDRELPPSTKGYNPTKDIKFAMIPLTQDERKAFLAKYPKYDLASIPL